MAVQFRLQGNEDEVRELLRNLPVGWTTSGMKRNTDGTARAYGVVETQIVLAASKLQQRQPKAVK